MTRKDNFGKVGRSRSQSSVNCRTDEKKSHEKARIASSNTSGRERKETGASGKRRMAAGL